VQRHLQLRIEAQGKYLQSILEKACKALNDQAAESAGLEAAREELSELAIKVSNDCQGLASLETVKMPYLPEIAAALENNSTSNLPTRIGNCSVESCLTSTGSPVSPMAMGLQAAALKKRSRPLFGNGDSLPLEGNMRQDIEWMMTNIGWIVGHFLIEMETFFFASLSSRSTCSSLLVNYIFRGLYILEVDLLNVGNAFILELGSTLFHLRH